MPAVSPRPGTSRQAVTVRADVETASPEPFARLELLPRAAVDRLRGNAERSVASWGAALDRLEPRDRESYVGLDLQLNLAREKARLDQVARGLAYQDDLTFGTDEERWFAAHGAELVRVHVHGLRALFVLDHAQYPDVPRLRQRFEAAARGDGLPALIPRPDGPAPQKGRRP